jgi:hypothetical protein
VPNVNPKAFAKYRDSIPPTWRAMVRKTYVVFRCESLSGLAWMTAKQIEQIESMLILMRKTS